MRSFPGQTPPTNLFKSIHDDFGDPDIWMLLDSSLQVCMLLKPSLRELSHPCWDFGRFVFLLFFLVFFK